MKKSILTVITLFTISITCYSQFGADYSSYGFNFVNNKYNKGLKNWTGSGIKKTSKFNIYKQDNYNNYALQLNAKSETLSINYDDFGYMDMNPCAFKINIRVKINEFSGSNDTLSFVLYTGQKKVDLKFTSDGVKYTNKNNQLRRVTKSITVNEWKTYSIALNSCNDTPTLMIENDEKNIHELTFPNDTTSQSINIIASTDGTASFSSEIDHLFIHSSPIKWWLGSSSNFVDDTPAGYKGTTGDRQHFLSLPNGETIGVNENGGGYVTFTELTPGGPNLDPFPKFGSGGTKTVRGYFHNNFNPVQAGISSDTGGHLATVTSTDNKLQIESFPLHSYFQDDFIENTPLVFPNGEVAEDENHPTIIDDDVYHEFGLNMRDELISELDFNSYLENVTNEDGISIVKHVAEWEYIRHPSHILQFHEVTEGSRLKLKGITGADNDMGLMRHKFEFRLNKDLGYEWILWKNSKGKWKSSHVTKVGDQIEINIDKDTPNEMRFLVFSKSEDPDEPGALSWFYPESDFNVNSTVGKSRLDKTEVSEEDRRVRMRIVADWRKTNWCRMNLYVRHTGLLAPSNGNPDVYESFRLEALQLFGSPNEILNEVINYNTTLPINEKIELNSTRIISPNPFLNEITVKGENLLNEKIKLYSILDLDISNSIEVISRSNSELILRTNNLSPGMYILKIGTTTKNIYKK